MIMARIAKDPTFELVAENAQIPDSDINFDQVRFYAKKIACLVRLSRELAEDAPNAATLIEETLGRALAVELDRMALVPNRFLPVAARPTRRTSSNDNPSYAQS